ncbi:MAG: inositol monophosphatase [Chloroflexi bacterium]|nr:inositol monophosphatase [Chloroflexota bacterium]
MKPTLKDLERLAREAGAILRDGYNKEHQVKFKRIFDPVTEIDRASEEFLLKEIHNRFPGSHILTEESGEIKGTNGGAWYIDPLDGTVNYSHHIPIFSVSIAYAFNGAVLFGAVYDPMRDEMFTAERGKGAQLNGKRIHAAKTTELEKSLLVTGFPYDTWESKRDNFRNFERLAKMTQGVRRLGSAAIDASYVAAGRFDAFWEFSLKPWDIAAGGLIAEEAGARVTALDGKADYISAPQSVLAAAPGIYPQLLKELNPNET